MGDLYRFCFFFVCDQARPEYSSRLKYYDRFLTQICLFVISSYHYHHRVKECGGSEQPVELDGCTTVDPVTLLNWIKMIDCIYQKHDELNSSYLWLLIDCLQVNYGIIYIYSCLLKLFMDVDTNLWLWTHTHRAFCLRQTRVSCAWDVLASPNLKKAICIL
jgi:hypothetical protein